MVSGVLTPLRTACAEALALLFPVSCAGCDEPDVTLCEACADALLPRPARRTIETPGGPVPLWTGLPFEGVAARVMRAIKEEGRTSLTSALAPALEVALVSAGAAGALIVPLPTSRASYRRRGYRVPELLVRRAGHRPHRLLRFTRQPGDQRGLDRESRRRNVEGSLRASTVPTPPPGAAGASPGASGRVGPAAARRVVVVDDVVTTGATLAEAVRALRAAGTDVVAAVAVAATPKRLGA